MQIALCLVGLLMRATTACKSIHIPFICIKFNNIFKFIMLNLFLLYITL